MVSIKHFIILFISVLIPSTAVSDTILLKSDLWCPYNCAPGSDRPGYAIEIARTIFEKAGHQLTYEIAPWSRALKLAQKGQIAAVVGVSREEAPELVFPEQEFGISVISFFVRKGYAWHFTGVKSLETENVGIMADDAYGTALDAYFKKNRNTDRVQEIRAAEPLLLNIRKLLRGRIDVILEDKAVFIETARSMGVLEKTEYAGIDPIRSEEDLEESKLYMAFSPKNPKSKEYAKILSNGIEEMRLRGELDAILAEYGLTDWRKDFADEIKKFRR